MTFAEIAETIGTLTAGSFFVANEYRVHRIRDFEDVCQEWTCWLADCNHVVHAATPEALVAAVQAYLAPPTLQVVAFEEPDVIELDEDDYVIDDDEPTLVTPVPAMCRGGAAQ